MKQNVWELRGRYSEAKKSKNFLEFTETVFSSEVCSITHKRLENNSENNDTNKVADLPSSMAFFGEVVVFDDIDDSWREKNTQKRVEEERPETSSMFSSNNDSECARVTKVIGNLPIAVYEGSPRRYGVRHTENNCSHPQLPSAQSLLASPSIYPPRPGFPQRVVCTTGENESDDVSVSINK